MKLIPNSHLQQLHLLRVGEIEFVNENVEPHTPAVQFVTGRFTSQKKKKLFSHFAQARQWINQTFHGLGPRHLQAYFNEFCYRLNQKLQEVSIFESLTQLCLSSPRIIYVELVRPKAFNYYPYMSSLFI